MIVMTNNTGTVDHLANACRQADAAHAALVMSGTASDRELTVAYIAALQAQRAMLLDCGGKADRESARLLGYEIDDLTATL